MRKLFYIPNQFHCIAMMGLILLLFHGCSFYKFSSVNIPPEIKTIFIDQFQMQTTFNSDIQFLPRFRNEFIQLTQNRTRLTVIDNKEDADWVIEGSLTNYNTELTALGSSTANSTTPTNVTALKLRVVISAQLVDKKIPDQAPKSFNVTDETTVDGNLTIVEIQNRNREDIVKRLSQQLFNQIYSNW